MRDPIRIGGSPEKAVRALEHLALNCRTVDEAIDFLRRSKDLDGRDVLLALFSIVSPRDGYNMVIDPENLLEKHGQVTATGLKLAYALRHLEFDPSKPCTEYVLNWLATDMGVPASAVQPASKRPRKTKADSPFPCSEEAALKEEVYQAILEDYLRQNLMDSDLRDKLLLERIRKYEARVTETQERAVCVQDQSLETALNPVAVLDDLPASFLELYSKIEGGPDSQEAKNVLSSISPEAVIWHASCGDIRMTAASFRSYIGRISGPCPGLFQLFLKFVKELVSSEVFPQVADHFTLSELVALSKKVTGKIWSKPMVNLIYRAIVTRLGSLEPSEFSAGIPRDRQDGGAPLAKDLSIDACVRWLLALSKLAFMPSSYRAVARYYSLLLDFQYNGRASLAEFSSFVTEYVPDFLSSIYCKKTDSENFLDCSDAMTTVERMGGACPFFSRKFLPPFEEGQVQAYLRQACTSALYQDLLEREYSHDIEVTSVSDVFAQASAAGEAQDASRSPLVSIEARVEVPAVNAADPATARKLRKFWTSLNDTLDWTSEHICRHLFLGSLLRRFNVAREDLDQSLQDLLRRSDSEEGGEAVFNSRRNRRQALRNAAKGYSEPSKPVLRSKNGLLPMGSDAFCTLFYDRESVSQAIRVEVWELNSRQLAERGFSLTDGDLSGGSSKELLDQIAKEVPSLKGNTLTLRPACLSGVLPLRIRPDRSSAVLLLRATVGGVSHIRMFIIGAPSLVSVITPMGVECSVLEGVLGHGLATAAFRTEVSSGDNLYDLSADSSFTLPFHTGLSPSQCEKLLIKIEAAKLREAPTPGIQMLGRVNPAGVSTTPEPTGFFCFPVRCHSAFYAAAKVDVPQKEFRFSFELSIRPETLLPTGSGFYRENAISGVVPVTATVRAALYNSQTNFQLPLDLIARGTLRIRFEDVSGRLLSQTTVSDQELRTAMETGSLELLVPRGCNEITSHCEVSVRTGLQGAGAELSFSCYSTASKILVSESLRGAVGDAPSDVPFLRVFGDYVTHAGSTYLAVHFTDMNNTPLAQENVELRFRGRQGQETVLTRTVNVGVSGLLLIPLTAAGWASAVWVVSEQREGCCHAVFNLPALRGGDGGFLMAAPTSVGRENVVIAAQTAFELDDYVSADEGGFESQIVLDLVDEEGGVVAHCGGTSRELAAVARVAASSGPWAPIALPPLREGRYVLRFCNGGDIRTRKVFSTRPAPALKSVSELRPEFGSGAANGEDAAVGTPDFLPLGILEGAAFRFTSQELLVRSGLRATQEGLEMRVELFDSDVSAILERGQAFLVDWAYDLCAHPPKTVQDVFRRANYAGSTGDLSLGTTLQSEEEAYLKRRRNLMYSGPEAESGESLSRAGSSLQRPGLTLFPVEVDKTSTEAVKMASGATLSGSDTLAGRAACQNCPAHGKHGGFGRRAPSYKEGRSLIECASNLPRLLAGGLSSFVPFSKAFSLAVSDAQSPVSTMRLELPKSDLCSEIFITLMPNDVSYSLVVRAIRPWSLSECAAACGLPSDKLSLPKKQLLSDCAALFPVFPRGISARDFATLKQTVLRALVSGISVSTLQEKIKAAGSQPWTGLQFAGASAGAPAAPPPTFVQRTDEEMEAALAAAAAQASDEVYVYVPREPSACPPSEFRVSGTASFREFLVSTGASIAGRYAEAADFMLGFESRSEEENLDLYLGRERAAPASGEQKLDAQANPSGHRLALFSHEVNLFLALQKPDFFAAYGLPLLSTRLRKDVVDTWLCHFALPASRGATESQVRSGTEEAPADICRAVEALYRPDVNGLERALLADMFSVCFGEERSAALLSTVAAEKRELAHPAREAVCAAVRGLLRSREAHQKRQQAEAPQPAPPAAPPRPEPRAAPRDMAARGAPPAHGNFMAMDAGADGAERGAAGARPPLGQMKMRKAGGSMVQGNSVRMAKVQTAPQAGYTRAEATKLYQEVYYLNNPGENPVFFSWSGFWNDFAHYLSVRQTARGRERVFAFSPSLMHLCLSRTQAELVLALAVLCNSDVRFSLQKPDQECVYSEVLTSARAATGADRAPEVVLLQTLCDRETGLAVRHIEVQGAYDLKTLVFVMASDRVTASLRVRVLLPAGCYTCDYSSDFHQTMELRGTTMASAVYTHSVRVVDPAAYKPGAAAVFHEGKRLAVVTCSPVSNAYRTAKKVLAVTEVIGWREVCELNDPECYLLYMTMSPRCKAIEVLHELQSADSGLSKLFYQSPAFAFAVLTALQRLGAEGVAWRRFLLSVLFRVFSSVAWAAENILASSSFVTATRPLGRSRKHDWTVPDVFSVMLGFESAVQPAALQAVSAEVQLSQKGMRSVMRLLRLCLALLSGKLRDALESKLSWAIPVAIPFPGGVQSVLPASPRYRRVQLDFSPFVIDRALSFAYKNILANTKIVEAYCNLLYDVAVLRFERQRFTGQESTGGDANSAEVAEEPISASAPATEAAVAAEAPMYDLVEDTALAYYLSLQNRYTEALARLRPHDSELCPGRDLMARVEAELSAGGLAPSPSLDELEAFLQPRAQAICLYAYLSVCTAEDWQDVRFLREVLALRPAFIERQPQSLRSYLFALQAYFEALVQEYPEATPAYFSQATATGVEGSRARKALQDRTQTREQRAALLGALGAAAEDSVALKVDQKTSSVTCTVELSAESLQRLWDQGAERAEAAPSAASGAAGALGELSIQGALRAYHFSPEYLICQKVDIALLTSALPSYEREVSLHPADGQRPSVFSGKLELPSSTLPCYVEFEYQGRVQRERVDAPGVVIICDNVVGLLTVYESREGEPAVASRAYVRVMAELNSGDYVFWKDGYTDLVGEFDYCTISALDITSVKHFVIYAETAGGLAAIEEQVAPPSRVML